MQTKYFFENFQLSAVTENFQKAFLVEFFLRNSKRPMYQSSLFWKLSPQIMFTLSVPRILKSLRVCLLGITFSWPSNFENFLFNQSCSLTVNKLKRCKKWTSNQISWRRLNISENYLKSFVMGLYFNKLQDYKLKP